MLNLKKLFAVFQPWGEKEDSTENIAIIIFIPYFM